MVKFLKGLATTLILTIIAIPLLLMLPVINIDAINIIQGNVFGYIRAGLYFLPVGTIVRILGITVSLFTFRVIVALVKTVWELLPLV